MNPVNWRLVKHPMNWITIFLMLVIVGTMGHMILSLFGVEPDVSQDTAMTSYGSVPASQAAPLSSPL
jgi:hypothetical protein